MRYRSLTAVAHNALAQALHVGDCAVDATVGNGHDTLFLARQVGPSGRVIGFDIQQQAIENTRQRLSAAQQEPSIKLYCASHDTLEQTVLAAHTGPVSAVMFNFGYLPGGDKSRITQAKSSCAAVRQASRIIAKGGLISLLSYRGHRGGLEEYMALEKLLSSFDQQRFQISRETLTQASSNTPVLFLISKRA
jgi:SAM-dependent methyltransferase